MKFMAAVTLAGFLAGLALAQEPSSKGVNFYSVAKEKELGQRLAAKLESGLPVVHEPKLEAYVSQLGAALAKYADSQFDFTFTLYEDRRPGWEAAPADAMGPANGGITPWDSFRGHASEPVAVAGGPIFIPMSLVAGATDEAELAFQLAHAMEHIALRHPTRMATKMELMQISVQTATIALDTHSGPASSIATPNGMLAFSRAAEREADYMAVQVLSKAGYSAEPVAEHLTAPPAQEVKPAFSPRPTAADRAKAIREEIEKLQLPSATTAPSEGFAEAKALAAPIR
jgi:predicted Zn-dependent protease